MSTTTTAPPTARRDHPAATHPGLVRLTAVELRKMTDTRAGFWLLLAVAAATIAAATVRSLTGGVEDHTLRAILAVAVQPSSILLPIVGILLVSSEWSQRTALSTFALVPQRSRVLAAKLVAAITASTAAVVMCLAIALLSTAVASPAVEHAWTLPVGILGQTTVYVVTAMIMGVGFGAVLLNSPSAIVASFVLPIAWSALSQVPAIKDPTRWLDQSRSLAPLTDRLLSTTEWARAATTISVWMLLPLLIGLWRINRSEIG